MHRRLKIEREEALTDFELHTGIASKLATILLRAVFSKVRHTFTNFTAPTLSKHKIPQITTSHSRQPLYYFHILVTKIYN